MRMTTERLINIQAHIEIDTHITQVPISINQYAETQKRKSASGA